MDDLDMDEKSEESEVLFEFTDTFNVNNLRCIEIEDYMLDELLNEKLRFPNFQSIKQIFISH